VKGDLRIEVHHILTVMNVNEPWSDENRVSVEEEWRYERRVHEDEYEGVDIRYEHPGLYDYGPDQLDEVLVELRRTADRDLSRDLEWNGERE
jgi:hypothetical protein